LNNKGIVMKKLLQVLVVVAVAIVVMFGSRWYMYVAYADTPYSEVGIALNGYAPAPLRQWGCAKLHARFPGQMPPLGCGAADGRNWI
jgi:hypothetical protein